jgi:hypothetical protein
LLWAPSWLRSDQVVPSAPESGIVAALPATAVVSGTMEFDVAVACCPYVVDDDAYEAITNNTRRRKVIVPWHNEQRTFRFVSFRFVSLESQQELLHRC